MAEAKHEPAAAVSESAASDAEELEALEGNTPGADASFKVKALSWLAAAVIRLLRAGVRLRHHGDGTLREWERSGTRFILAFWHRHLLLMPYAYQAGRGGRGRRISVLVSRSTDGELIARTVAHFGIDSSRGSSSRGGAAGVRSLLRKKSQGYDLAFTPDGPRGPRGEVQPGVVVTAAMTGLPVVPVALGASRAKLLRSWDRFVVPLPPASVHFVYGEPLWVERRGDLDAAARELKRRLDGAEARAEGLAGRRGGVGEGEPPPGGEGGDTCEA